MGREIFPSKIIVGNSAIATFEENGRDIHRNPIEQIEHLVIVGLQANTPRLFDMKSIGFDFDCQSLWGYAGISIQNNEDLTLTIKNENETAILWEVNLKGNLNALGKTFSYPFNKCCICRNHKVIVQCSIPLQSLTFFGKKAYLNDLITPTF
jgi:hypothetical protein